MHTDVCPCTSQNLAMERARVAHLPERWRPFGSISAPITWWDVVKTVLVTVFVLPVRSLVMLLLFLSFLLYSLLLMRRPDMCPTGEGGPAPRSWRRRLWIYLTRAHARAFLFALGFVRITRSGLPPPQTGTVVCNHLSWLDIVVLNMECFPSFVSRADVSSMPIFGWLGRIMLCIFVQRGGAVSGQSDVLVQRQVPPEPSHDGEECVQVAMAVGHPSLPPLVVFAEGTTTNGLFLMNFKTGAFRAGVPVQPLLLRYPFKSCSPTWTTLSGLKSFLRVLTVPMHRLHVEWMPPISPTEEERGDPTKYARSVCEQMAARLGVPVTSATFADKKEYERRLVADPASVTQSNA